MLAKYLQPIQGKYSSRMFRCNFFILPSFRPLHLLLYFPIDFPFFKISLPHSLLALIPILDSLSHLLTHGSRPQDRDLLGRELRPGSVSRILFYASSAVLKNNILRRIETLAQRPGKYFRWDTAELEGSNQLIYGAR
jgi:hypothetical protein